MKKRLLMGVLLFCILFAGLSAFASEEEPKVYSQCAVLIEKESGRVLFEKNMDTQCFPASIVKVMTALLVMENASLDEVAVASENAVMSVPLGSSHVAFVPDEEITVRDLMYALMLPSANDAANILAEHVGGSIENFVTMMNERAKELGCQHTNFTNPSGIHDDAQVTTAYDMALIARKAISFDAVREMMSTMTYSIAPSNKCPSEKMFYNQNKTLQKGYDRAPRNYYYPYSIGMKTGYTSQAQNTYIGVGEKDGMTLITVLLGSQETPEGGTSSFIDSNTLMDYGYSNYVLEKIVSEEPFELEIEGWGNRLFTKRVLVQYEHELLFPVRHGEEVSEDFKHQKLIESGYKNGDVFAEVTFSVPSMEIGTATLRHVKTLDKGILSVLWKGIWVTLVIAILLFLVLLVWGLVERERAKKRRRRRRLQKNDRDLMF